MKDYPYSMNAMYKVLAISKQAVHQHRAAEDRRKEELAYVGMIVEQVRADHPTMGVRDIYYMMRPKASDATDSRNTAASCTCHPPAR